LTTENEGVCAEVDCCPEDYECVGDEGEELCVRIDNCRGIFSCSDYENEDACDDDDCGKGTSTRSCGGGRSIVEACGVEISDITANNRRSCKCFWDEDANDGEGECKQKHEVTTVNYKSLDVAGKYECIVDVQTTGCTDGIMTITKNVEAIWLENVGQKVEDACSNAVCAGYAEKEIDCGRPALQLPFFTMINFVIVAFVLVVFYVVQGEVLSRRKIRK
jgi:hypothetical protein